MSKHKTFDSVPETITVSQFEQSALKLPTTKTGGDKHAVWYFHWARDYLLVYNAHVHGWCLISRDMLDVFLDAYFDPNRLLVVAIRGADNATWYRTREDCVNAHAAWLHEVAVCGDVAIHTAERVAAKAAGAGKAASRAWKRQGFTQ